MSSFVDLNQVIGAILRSLAQARVSADAYSRDVSRYYEQDSLLRLFPVPRTEINEVNIDLKFAIAEMQRDLGASSAGTGAVRDQYAANLLEATFGALREKSNESALWTSYLANFESEQTAALLVPILDVIEDPDAQVDLLTPLEGLIESRIYGELETALVDQADLRAASGIFTAKGTVYKSVRRAVTAALASELKEMDVALDQGDEVYALGVKVSAADLQDIPELAISSLVIRTSMRNYVWSQVGTDGDETVRRLVPE